MGRFGGILTLRPGKCVVGGGVPKPGNRQAHMLLRSYNFFEHITQSGHSIDNFYHLAFPYYIF